MVSQIRRLQGLKPQRDMAVPDVSHPFCMGTDIVKAYYYDYVFAGVSDNIFIPIFFSRTRKNNIAWSSPWQRILEFVGEGRGRERGQIIADD